MERDKEKEREKERESPYWCKYIKNNNKKEQRQEPTERFPNG